MLKQHYRVQKCSFVGFDILSLPTNYVSILHKCRREKNLLFAKQVYAHLQRNGLESDSFIGNHIVPMFVACGSLSDAQEVFDRMVSPNAHAWTALITGYVQCGCTGRALNLYEKMLNDNVHPSSHTLATILKSCTDLEDVRNIHRKISEQGFERHLFVGSALVNLYAKFGSMSEAKEAFDKLSERNVVSWTSLIAGYVEHGHAHEAWKIFGLMQQQGFSPNYVTYVSILRACGTTPLTHKGWEIHMDVTRNGLHSDPLVGSSLVDMYSKCGFLSEAQMVFNKLPKRDVVMWNALISGYAKHGPLQEALSCFRQMHGEVIIPDLISFVGVLKACGNMGALEEGQTVHIEVEKRKLEKDQFIGNTLIDMYTKCGLLMDALHTFERLPAQDLTSFNCMIKGFAMHHDGNMAVKIFERMEQKDIVPDSITFTCLLSACSHSNLVQKGQDIFKLMTTKYVIMPTIDHVTCLVELVARSGHLYEAEKLLESVPHKACKDMWITLLTACKASGEIEVGCKCFEQLLGIDPECSTPYMLMKNISAIAGRWNDVSRIEEMRRKLGANKKPASAMIEVGSKVQAFVVGSEYRVDISSLLDILQMRLRIRGSVPNLVIVSESPYESIIGTG